MGPVGTLMFTAAIAGAAVAAARYVQPKLKRFDGRSKSRAKQKSTSQGDQARVIELTPDPSTGVYRLGENE